MKMMKVFVVASLFAVCGCGGPSESDVKDAFIRSTSLRRYGSYFDPSSVDASKTETENVWLIKWNDGYELFHVRKGNSGRWVLTPLNPSY